MNFEDRRLFYNRCNPDEPLEPGDARNLDIDAQGTPDRYIRGTNWVQELAARIELSETPVCELFTGLPGSGKSTELLRLAERLEKPDGAHLFPVVINAEEVLDLASPVDIPEILIAILFKTDQAILRAKGKDPRDAMGETHLARFWHWLRNTDLTLSKAEMNAGFEVADPNLGGKVSTGGKLVVDMKTDPSLRSRIRNKVSSHMTSFLFELREEIEKTLLPEVKRRGYGGMIIILDSLEKLRGLSTNWHEVLASAERIFVGGATYLKLPVHVIYTIPPALVLRMNAPVHFMPMIKLQDREGNVFQPGLDAAREIIRRRVPDEVLKAHFAPLDAENELRQLLQWSGGYPREIVRLLQRIVQQSEISGVVIERLLSEAGDSLRRIIPGNAFSWLAQVALDRSLTIESEAHREAADLMLSNNVVLRYRNSSEWFDIHPAVLQLPGVQEAIQQLRRTRARPRSLTVVRSDHSLRD